MDFFRQYLGLKQTRLKIQKMACVYNGMNDPFIVACKYIFLGIEKYKKKILKYREMKCVWLRTLSKFTSNAFSYRYKLISDLPL